MLIGWFAIAAAVLTVTGLVTLLAFFATGTGALGTLNDVNTIAMAVVTVPVALALHPIASRVSGPITSAAVASNLVGVLLVAVFSALLVAGIMTFEGTLTLITVGNGLIGAWVLVTAALLLSGAAVPAALGWLGIAGGAGLGVVALAFPILGREHPAIAAAGLVAVIGLVGFYSWMGLLMLGSRVGPHV